MVRPLSGTYLHQGPSGLAGRKSQRNLPFSGVSSSKKRYWSEQVSRLSPEFQPIAKTFGELAMQDSGAIEFNPRYPNNVKQVPRFPLPSNPAQMKLSLDLKKRLNRLGLQVDIDAHYNVIGKLPTNLPKSFLGRERIPVLALKAHLDTTYEQPNQGVIPKIHYRYQGQPLEISSKNNKGEKVLLDPETSPALKRRVGEDVITASGNTLLGADAKAGVAEILEALSVLQDYNNQHPTKPLYHPDLRVVFTVDEETNLLGARTIDLKRLGADYAIDLDDTEPGQINVRSYFGQNINIKIRARMVHAAEAANIRLANPMMLAAQLVSSLPKKQLLENKTGQMQGYLFLDQMKTNLHEAEILILARDFNEAGVQRKVKQVIDAVEKLQQQIQGAPAEIQWRVESEYRNPKIDTRSVFTRHLVQSAKNAGIKPKITGFRGCSDAAIWSERGLPTINIGCGWQNAHQLTEWVSVQDLYRMSRYLLKIITDWPTNGPKITLQQKRQQLFQPLAWPKVSQSPN